PTSAMSDDKPFNPFYIGPHPSKACAIPEQQGQQCLPGCDHGQGQGTAGPSGTAGGTLIVGMAGPSGGVAAIFTTKEAATATPAAGASTAPKNNCKPYPCMEGARANSPGCD
ncbi:hypothetical protein KR009_000366, partial [Drosophila setifemur]